MVRNIIYESGIILGFMGNIIRKIFKKWFENGSKHWIIYNNII
jgi:hypothetical protein